MKMIPCPLNGPRPEDEFICGGAVKAMPPQSADDIAWRDYLFMESTARRRWEWWCHLPAGFWFAALRDLTTDEFLQTCSAEEAEEKAAAFIAAEKAGHDSSPSSSSHAKAEAKAQTDSASSAKTKSTSSSESKSKPEATPTPTPTPKSAKARRGRKGAKR